jgi:hypothetical protein
MWLFSLILAGSSPYKTKQLGTKQSRANHPILSHTSDPLCKQAIKLVPLAITPNRTYPSPQILQPRPKSPLAKQQPPSLGIQSIPVPPTTFRSVRQHTHTPNTYETSQRSQQHSIYQTRGAGSIPLPSKPPITARRAGCTKRSGKGKPSPGRIRIDAISGDGEYGRLVVPLFVCLFVYSILC